MAVQAVSELNRGMADFSLSLYNSFTAGNKNIFLSPYSVAACLLLADLGANGETEEQIRHALGVGELSKETVHALYQQLRESLNDETKGTATLAIANRMFVKLGLKIDETYAKDSKQLYGSDAHMLDFGGDPKGSRQTINKWVEQQTTNKIKDLIPEDIDDMTMMILVNAIYFKANWEYSFDAAKTYNTDFKISRSLRQKVEMMADTDNFNFLQDKKLRFSALSLPYKDRNLSMVFILPDEIDGLSELENKLTGEILTALCRDIARSSCKLILGIPKFKMEATFELTQALPRLGVRDMFDSSAADFSTMLPTNPDAYVSNVIHKAFIKVNEEGTEAAAESTFSATFSMEPQTPPPPPRKFILDHPFMFLIWHRPSNTILFMGRYVVPPKQSNRSIQYIHSIKRKCSIL